MEPLCVILVQILGAFMWDMCVLREQFCATMLFEGTPEPQSTDKQWSNVAQCDSKVQLAISKDCSEQ